MSTTYHVSVPAFEGPFDLLLQLIARRKVDIYEVSIAEITDEYLAAMGQLESVDLEVTTEFLIVAATLIELKAARLLPATDDPDTDQLALEARDLLYARLLDYRTFREAAGHLQHRLEQHRTYMPREVVIEPQFAKLRPEVTLGITPDDFALLAARVFAERPTNVLDLSHVQPVRISVGEAAGMITDELQRTAGPLTFDELTAGCRHVAEVVVHFLACLELYKLDHVDLQQDGNFGSLRVTWTPDQGLTPGGSFLRDAYQGDDGPGTTADTTADLARADDSQVAELR